MEKSQGKPKISIIVPFFNSKSTIRRCLDSIVNQTMDELEIIVVDDHSTDDSLQVLKEYVSAYKGPKQFVITQTVCGKGPGAARNTGIDIAGGEYIGFVDSDDIILENFCESLYCAASATNADLAFCNISFDYPDGRSILKFNPTIHNGPQSHIEKKAYFRKYVTFFTTYIYRKSMLDSFCIRFPLTRSAEDSCFLACSLLTSTSMASVETPLYHYIIHQDSISKKKDPDRFRQKLTSFRHLRAFAKEHNLYRQYRGIINYLVIKKGYCMALKDLLNNYISR